MTLRKPFGYVSERTLGLALPLFVTLTSCSSSQGPPQVFADVSLGGFYDPNHNMQNACHGYQSLTPAFNIGEPTGACDPKNPSVCNSMPQRIQNGAQIMGAEVVNVNCSVKGGYDINLQASLGSTGAFALAGHVSAMGGMGLSGEINYDGSDYTSNSCSVAFTFMGSPVPQMPPIAPGRIWAHMSCPQMGDPTGVRHTMLMDMSLVPEECDGEADFIFENCSM